MSQRFLFKFFVIVATTLILTAIALPFVAAVFTLKEGAWKYGYTFLEINWKSNLLVALAFGMSLAVWNAFEFERHRNIDISQYFKPRQVYHFYTSDPVSIDALRSIVESNILRKGWTVRKWHKNGVQILRRNYFMKDVVKINTINGGLKISSEPRWKILLIDMARNFRNVENVSRRLKELK